MKIMVRPPHLIQAVDEWNALVEREDAYSLPTTAEEGGDRAAACHAAWRAKMCEWCFEVVDYW